MNVVVCQFNFYKHKPQDFLSKKKNNNKNNKNNEYKLKVIVVKFYN